MIASSQPNSRPLLQDNDQTTVWQGAFHPSDSTVMITTGGDGSANVYEHVPATADINLVTQAQISHRPILYADWHKDKEGLVAFGCLDDRVYLASTVPACYRP